MVSLVDELFESTVFAIFPVVFFNIFFFLFRKIMPIWPTVSSLTGSADIKLQTKSLLTLIVPFFTSGFLESSLKILFLRSFAI